MFKSLLVLGAFALSAVAFAADGDGSASFRFNSGAILSFDYHGDLKDGKLTGNLVRNGFNQVNLSASRDGGWSGSLGTTSVSVAPIQTEENGQQTVTIQTIEGEYVYNVQKDANGNFEISTIGLQGDLLHASLTAKGLSVDSDVMSFEADRDAQKPYHFEGNAVIDFWDMESDTVELNARGSLDPNALAKSDTALFLLLYVLPFHLGN